MTFLINPPLQKALQVDTPRHFLFVIIILRKGIQMH